MNLASPISTFAQLGTLIARAPALASAAARENARLALVDLMGCMLAGASMPAAARARAALLRQGAGPAPLYGAGLGLAPSHAALANATAAHALDFDDWEEPGNSHPSAVMIPALLALLDDGASGDASGEAVADAYAIGFEVLVRLAARVNFAHYNAGWHTTGTLAAFAAAAASARLHKLDERAAAAALSLTASQAAGMTRQFGSDAKPLQAGFAARAGVEATLLAAEGLSGQAAAFDGARGWRALAGGDAAPGSRDPGLDLGPEIWRNATPALERVGLVFKPWPSCGYTHRLIDAALALRARSAFDRDAVAAIELAMPDFHKAVLPFDRPENREQALFSAPCCVAMALVGLPLTLRGFDAEPWKDPQISALIARMTVRVFAPARPERNYDPDEPDRLRVVLDDGAAIEAACPYPYGHPRKPMRADAIRAKFEDLAPWTEKKDRDRLMDWIAAPRLRTTLAPFERARP